MGADGALSLGRNRSTEEVQYGGCARRGRRGCCEARERVSACPGGARGDEDAEEGNERGRGCSGSPEFVDDGGGGAEMPNGNPRSLAAIFGECEREKGWSRGGF